MPQINMPKPQPKQLEFFQAKNRFVAYGGAKGGGKSWSLRWKLVLLCLKFPGITCMIVRKTWAELWENHIQILLILLKPLLDGKLCSYSNEHKTFTFKNGSRLRMGYCSNIDDAEQYNGIEFDVIAIDEATQHEEEVFNRLSSCVRGFNNFPKRVYLTCNPGGVGHSWVKRLFVDRQFKDDEKPEDYVFIKALATDNAYNGEGYMHMLNTLPENLRDAWRDGNWDTFVGQYFPEWEDQNLDVERFIIPDHCKITLSIDYGLDCFAPIWFATDENGTDYILHCKAIKNVVIGEAANIIKQTEKELGFENRRITRYAPPDLWSRKSDAGKSTVDIFREKGLVFIKADNNRETGWLAIKQRLADNKLKKFKGVGKELTYCMRLLQYDDKKLNDVSKNPHDITHLPDALRYFCIMRTRKVKPPEEAIHQNYLTHDVEPKIMRKHSSRIKINPNVFKSGWN